MVHLKSQDFVAEYCHKMKNTLNIYFQHLFERLVSNNIYIIYFATFSMEAAYTVNKLYMYSSYLLETEFYK